MKISYSQSGYNSNTNNTYSFKAANKYRFNQFKAAALGAVSLLGVSCATISGGNFIYDSQTNKIVQFKDYKGKYHIEGEDTFYNADTLRTEDLEIKPNLKILPTKDAYVLEYFKKSGLEIKPNIFSINYLRSTDLDKLIDENKERLVGSCLFTKRENKAVSDLIVDLTRGSLFKNEFVPSHVSTIFEKDGVLKVLNLAAPKAIVSNLKDTLKDYKGKLVLYLRDYDIDPKRFSESIAKYEGVEYSNLSAIQTLFNIEFKEGLHCSEVHLLEMQKEGLLKSLNANKITPNTLLRLLINERFKK